MGSHKSKDCSKKISPSQHSCAKCYNSNVSAEKDDYRSHNATDPLCPVCVREGETCIIARAHIGPT